MIISNEKITDKKFNYYDKSQNSLLGISTRFQIMDRIMYLSTSELQLKPANCWQSQPFYEFYHTLHFRSIIVFLSYNSLVHNQGLYFMTPFLEDFYDGKSLT